MRAEHPAVQNPAHRLAPELDFLCIGAAKAGTTSLFEYLRLHHRIWIPIRKELPFFSVDHAWEAGWPAYFQEHFVAAPKRALLGKVTPQYMADMRVPGRVAKIMPQVTLIALLRDPVERAYSDWRMRIRIGQESRDFEEAVRDQLNTQRLERARRRIQGDGIPPRDLYLARSEYGRILSAWFEHFHPRQFFIEFSDELAENTQEVMNSLLRSLRVSGEIPPRHLQRRHHQGGDEERFPGLVLTLTRNAAARKAWHLLPFERRLRLLRWFDSNLRYRTTRPLPAPETRARLKDFFQQDTALLQRLLGREIPWGGS